MSSTPFGGHVQRGREMRGVSLAEVSAATRISTRFLEAIDSDRWESLPGGVFNRGFIRSVARYPGLDEDRMVPAYALETRGRVEAGVVPDPPMEMPRNWKPAIVAAIVLVVILAGVTLAYARYGGKIAERLHLKPAGVTGSAAAGVPLAYVRYEARIAESLPWKPAAVTGSPTSGDAASGANDGATGASGVGA